MTDSYSQRSFMKIGPTLYLRMLAGMEPWKGDLSLRL